MTDRSDSPLSSIPSSAKASPAPNSSSSTGKRKRQKSHVDELTSKRRRGNGPIRHMEEWVFLESLGLDIEDEGSKPVLVLTDFSIFDSRGKMVDIEELEEADGEDRDFFGEGYARPFYENEEDEGQDDLDVGQYVKLSSIFSYCYEYLASNPSRCVSVQTQWAWYYLENPSQEYREIFRDFFHPRFIPQMIISTAKIEENSRWDYVKFLDDFCRRPSPFGGRFSEADLKKSVKQHLLQAISEIEDFEFPEVPFLKKLLPDDQRALRKKSRNTTSIPRQSRANPDLEVFRCLNRTTVTGLVAALAEGVVSEPLRVLGAKSGGDKKEKSKAEAQRLLRAIECAHSDPCVEWLEEDIFLKKYKKHFVTSVKVRQELFRAGDVVILPIGEDDSNPSKTRKRRKYVPRSLPHQSEISEGACIADYFWFAKIMYIDVASKTIHVQWFNHGSQIVIGEVARPRELFLQDLCGDVGLELICGKIIVRYTATESQWALVPDHEYFYKLMFDPVDGSFTSPNRERMKLVTKLAPPDNCPTCLLFEIQRQQHIARPLYETVHGTDTMNGVSYRDKCWHFGDFVLYRTSDAVGPACIGQIIGFRSKGAVVTVKKMGRITDIKDLPGDYFRDERHLYLTNETDDFPVEDLVHMIYVSPHHLTAEPRDKWVSQSPYHFYVKFVFREHPVTRELFENRKRMDHTLLEICTSCYETEQRHMKEMKKFLKAQKRKPLRTLDLFGGTGAFSLGLAEGCLCLKVTHAIEIAPSAAITYRRNSPETIVTNQCINEYVYYAVKSSRHDHNIQKPMDLFDKSQPIADPPKPGEIDVILAGFPCQSFSSLNMYKRRNDPKSNLLLSALSEVDRLRPKYCFFENVPGFVSHFLKATRAEDDIEQGGLKLLHRALHDMGYQTRFGLLEAGHYGAPQSRVRFFMIAAKLGLQLPSLPQPTHDFPSVKSLRIGLSDDTTITPIKSERGLAAHKFVSISDAIGDLRCWDWEHPEFNRLSPEEQVKRRKRHLPSVSYNGKEHPGWGADLEQWYKCPLTRFQLDIRQRPTNDLQHFTRPIEPKAVIRTHDVELMAGADFRSIKSHNGQYQTNNPEAWLARGGSAYGRLDADGYFNTTVTNMHPTAKQSRVLHPSCYRMLTVRELARSQGFPDWYNFVALGNNVITHRLIGNAVAWPVSRALGRSLRDVLFETWQRQERERIEIDSDE